jgi:solute:Na+ symporter, SSS family
MIPVIVILLYLVGIAVIGGIAYQRGRQNTEDFFLANRSIGAMVFFLSIFATNMTAFAILGSSGVAYRRGIGILGLMASSSGLVIPLSIFFIGTRIWALGKKFGHQTQVQFFRDRWECDKTGTVMFALSAAMLIPYMIISIIGGGRVLADISIENGQPLIPYWLGCLIVTVVVTLNVFLGGMRGVVWANIFQTILFLLFGAVAVMVINSHVPGGIPANIEAMKGIPPQAALLTRERIPQLEFMSYFLIPLSSIMFPHMSIMCLSAQKITAFKRTVILYPLAIMAIWLPCVFLGVLGARLIPGLEKSDSVLLHLLGQYSPAWLAGLLGAGIISAVMGSDCHQVLALSTMFTKDIFEHYGGKVKFGEKGSVVFARIFIIVLTAVAYIVALNSKENIFEIAIRYAFSGFAALAPIMVGALFWKRSTKFGALAATLFVAGMLVSNAMIVNTHKPGDVVLSLGGTEVITLTKPPTPPKRPGGAAGERSPGGRSSTGELMVPGTSPSGSGPAYGDGGIAGGPDGGAKVAAGGPPAGAGEGKAPGGPGGPGGPKKPPPFNPDLRFMGLLMVVPMVIGSALLMLIVSLLTPAPSKATIDKYFPPRKAGSDS